MKLTNKQLYIITGVLATTTVTFIMYGVVKRNKIMKYLTKGYSEWKDTGVSYEDIKTTIFSPTYIAEALKRNNLKTWNTWTQSVYDKYVLRFHDELVGNSIVTSVSRSINVDEDVINKLLSDVGTKLRLSQLNVFYKKKYGKTLYDDLQNVGSSDKQDVFNTIIALPINK